MDRIGLNELNIYNNLTFPRLTLQTCIDLSLLLYCAAISRLTLRQCYPAVLRTHCYDSPSPCPLSPHDLIQKQDRRFRIRGNHTLANPHALSRTPYIARNRAKSSHQATHPTISTSSTLTHIAIAHGATIQTPPFALHATPKQFPHMQSEPWLASRVQQKCRRASEPIRYRGVGRCLPARARFPRRWNSSLS